jgi:hypothetical protein
MAVHILTLDAQRHIAGKISKFNELISKWRDMGKALAARDSLPEIRTNITALETEVREHQRILGYHDAWSESEESPVYFRMTPDSAANLFGKKISGMVFLFQNTFYSVLGPYTDNEARVLLLDYVKKKKRKVEFLVNRTDDAESEQEFVRKPIPEDVRHEVWRRDKGRCVECGSIRNLEYDHLIPVSQGGSNTARNLQLLCEECNRRKSDSI